MVSYRTKKTPAIRKQTICKIIKRIPSVEKSSKDDYRVNIPVNKASYQGPGDGSQLVKSLLHKHLPELGLNSRVKSQAKEIQVHAELCVYLYA